MTESLRQGDTAAQREGTSLADLIEVPCQPSLRDAVPPSAWIKIVVIAALFMAVNWRQFPLLVQIWQHDANWSHGFIIPLFSLYLLYARRDELFAARRRACVWALPLVLLSIFSIIVSFYPIRTMWFCQLSMIALLFSVVLYLGGIEVIRITWLPILFLVFAMPVPDMLYTRISVPLQELAGKCASGVLQIAGVQIAVRASSLVITSLTGRQYGLTIAEACSGVRSLMAYVALGVAWAYLENRPIWQRMILVASAVPIAIFCNVIRVTITCSMYVWDRPELGKDFMHEFTGMLVMIPAVLMFWGLGKLLERLFVEVEEEEAGQSSGQETSAESVNA